MRDGGQGGAGPGAGLIGHAGQDTGRSVPWAGNLGGTMTDDHEKLGPMVFATLPPAPPSPPSAPLTWREAWHLAGAIWRWLAVFVTLALGVAAIVKGNQLAADGVEPWLTLRRELRTGGFSILIFAVTCVVAGAVLQTFPAVTRRGRVGVGWLATAGVLGHHLLVGLLAVGMSAMMPVRPAGVQRDYASAAYEAILLFLVFGLTVFVLVGGVFMRPENTGPLRRERPSERREMDMLPAGLLMVLVFSWFCGLVVFAASLLV